MGRTIVALLLLAAVLLAQDSRREYLNQGVRAFNAGKYAEAINAFEQAVNADPSNPNTHLYLATAYMARWAPGLETPENQDFARRAEKGFLRVLEGNPNAIVALKSLAKLAYWQRRLDEAKSWNERVLAADETDKEANYSLGVIAWSKFYPEYGRVRLSAGMKPEDPGPIIDANARQDLRNRMGSLLEDGIAKLSKAIELDPTYDDAMAYLNLLLRERGDLRDNAQDCAADVSLADRWVQKALATRRARGGLAQPSGVASPPPPPPPPSLQFAPQPAADGTPQRIRIGGNMQAASLIQKVTPAYPPEARAARIQGTVRFEALIGTDGHVINLQLLNGHPLLVPASAKAVLQWLYKPTLLDGRLVEVITQIDVNFTLEE